VRQGRIRRLLLVLSLTFVYMIAEAVGGYLTNSLALIADAGHMFTDVAAISLTLAAIWFASRPATAKRTFGYYRLEILAALFNGLFLAVVAAIVIREAFERWSSPPSIDARLMLIIAAGGLVVNIIAASILHRGHKHDLNMRGAFLHVMSDLLGSVAAITAGILMIAYGWYWADPIISIVISLIILVSAARLIYASINVLLEGTPPHIDLAAVEAAILDTDGVVDVHDLHVWTISSGNEALSAHIVHGSEVRHSSILTSLQSVIRDEFGIDHMTLQLESSIDGDETVYECETGSRCFETRGSTFRHSSAS
jgi:cobalt-zinc-cadmium efflux system protein